MHEDLLFLAGAGFGEPDARFVDAYQRGGWVIAFADVEAAAFPRLRPRVYNLPSVLDGFIAPDIFRHMPGGNEKIITRVMRRLNFCWWLLRACLGAIFSIGL